MLIVFTGFVVTITPIKSEDHVLEGGNITLGCKFDGYVNNLQWYRQYPASKPEFLLLILHSTSNVQHAEPQNPRLHTRLDTEKTLVFLEISSVKLSDSAIYYCALQPTVRGNTERQYKNEFTLNMHLLPIFALRVM